MLGGKLNIFPMCKVNPEGQSDSNMNSINLLSMVLALLLIR